MLFSDRKYTYHGEHCIKYRIVESPDVHLKLRSHCLLTEIINIFLRREKDNDPVSRKLVHDFASCFIHEY